MTTNDPRAKLFGLYVGLYDDYHIAVNRKHDLPSRVTAPSPVATPATAALGLSETQLDEIACKPQDMVTSVEHYSLIVQSLRAIELRAELFATKPRDLVRPKWWQTSAELRKPVPLTVHQIKHTPAVTIALDEYATAIRRWGVLDNTPRHAIEAENKMIQAIVTAATGVPHG